MVRGGGGEGDAQAPVMCEHTQKIYQKLLFFVFQLILKLFIYNFNSCCYAVVKFIAMLYIM